MKLYEPLTAKEKFLGETVVQKNIKVAIVTLLVAIVYGILINEIIGLVIDLWGLIA